MTTAEQIAQLVTLYTEIAEWHTEEAAKHAKEAKSHADAVAWYSEQAKMAIVRKDQT